MKSFYPKTFTRERTDYEVGIDYPKINQEQRVIENQKAIHGRRIQKLEEQLKALESRNQQLEEQLKNSMEVTTELLRTTTPTTRGRGTSFFPVKHEKLPPTMNKFLG